MSKGTVTITVEEYNRLQEIERHIESEKKRLVKLENEILDSVLSINYQPGLNVTYRWKSEVKALEFLKSFKDELNNTIEQRSEYLIKYASLKKDVLHCGILGLIRLKNKLKNENN